jgi:hypothetical protein
MTQSFPVACITDKARTSVLYKPLIQVNPDNETKATYGRKTYKQKM